MTTNPKAPYAEPATSVLTRAQGDTEAGQVATRLAKALRRAGAPGPLATTTGGNNIAVVVVWLSGRDRIVAAVEVWDHTPTIYVGAYEDRDVDAPAWEHTAHTVPAAVAEITRLIRCGEEPADTSTATADTPTRPRPGRGTKARRGDSIMTGTAPHSRLAGDRPGRWIDER